MSDTPIKAKNNLADRILALLKETKKLSDADIKKINDTYNNGKGGKFQDVLIKMDYVTEKEFTALLSGELKIPFLNLGRYKLDPEICKMVPEKIARNHKLIPISKIGNTLTLAMVDPFNVMARDDIAILTKHKVECVICTEKDIEDAFNKIYASDSEKIGEVLRTIENEEQVEVMKSEDDLDSAHSTDSGHDEAPIVKIVDALLREALTKRASDIHIEPQKGDVRVRYRIDGNLQEVFRIPKKNQNAVLSRLKIMSRLDITESRVPQDGRFKIKTHDKEVDFRVSILPVQSGGKVVMRILDKRSLSVGLDNLGFAPSTLQAFKSAIAKPFGMLLITGPTGSGKSTTLYSILNQLNTSERNIITIEDPIEYQVRGISQIQAKPEIGLDFASGLRAILRQSPDVVMVGEIRDSETADIAIKASLTGQLVLSTLHTNDATGAMTRMIDMGIEPFLIASSVILVAAQRLCRKVCLNCREKIEIPNDVFARMKVNLDKICDAKSRTFYRGKGCAKCNNTGFFGRMAVMEVLTVDNKIRDMVTRRASSYELKEYAVKNGLVTLRDDAMLKLCQGITTLDEVIRVTSEDE